MKIAAMHQKRKVLVRIIPKNGIFNDYNDFFKPKQT